jgi:MFS family permease
MAGESQENVSFLGRFTVVLKRATPAAKGVMRELWVIFAAKFLAVTAYKVMVLTLVLWLMSDFGYSDEHALGVVATWSILMTVFTVLVGSFADAVGLRKAFLLGAWVCLLARLLMTFTTVKWLALAGGLIPLALGEALGTPVLVAAVRRYSTTAQRSVAFSLIYAIQNLGFLVAYRICDYVRQGMGVRGHFTLPLTDITITTYQTLFLVSCGFELCLLPVLYFGIRSGAEATDEGVKLTPEQPKYPHESLWNVFRLTVADTLRGTGQLYAKLARQRGFYSLLGFLMLIAFVKLIFMQMDYVYPTFGIRELGAGAPILRLLEINSILIIVLVPVVGAFTRRLPAYTAVIVGCVISAVSGFVMALPLSWFEPLASGPLGRWIGVEYLSLSGNVHPYYVMIALYVVLLSIGEAFYSPRVYEYAASIAPKGQEASYGALSYVPFFLAKLIVGTVSGVLLARYCPETGARHSQTMWLIIALITTICPLGLITLRRWIRVPEAGRED